MSIWAGWREGGRGEGQWWREWKEARDWVGGEVNRMIACERRAGSDGKGHGRRKKANGRETLESGPALS